MKPFPRFVMTAILAGLSELHASAAEPLKDPPPDKLLAAREKFVAIQLKAFEKNPAGQPIEIPSSIKTTKIKWEKTRKEIDWQKLSAAIGEYSVSRELTSVVSIKSSKGNGAAVKYQRTDERRKSPHQAHDLTTAVETMVPGEYYMWAERNGLATSSTNTLYHIKSREDDVTLLEF